MRRETNKLLSLVRWEFLKDLKFPVIELIIVSAIYISLPNLMVIHSGLLLSKESLGENIFTTFMKDYVFRLGIGFIGSYDVVVFIYSLLTSMGFALEISSGNLRLLFSYPLKKRDIFLIKFLCLFILPSFIYVATGFLILFLLGYSMFFYADIVLITLTILVFLLETFFVFSVSLSFSLFLRDPLASFMSSFLVLYGLYRLIGVLPSRIKIFIVPENLENLLFLYKLKSISYQVDILYFSIILTIVLSISLFLVSYIYFTRVYEACQRS